MCYQLKTPILIHQPTNSYAVDKHKLQLPTEEQTVLLPLLPFLGISDQTRPEEAQHWQEN